MALEVADQIILLDQGEIIMQDETEKILKDKDLLEQHGLELPFCFQRG